MAPPPISALRIRPAQSADLESLTELEAECFPTPWSPSGLRTELTRPGGEFLLALAPRPVGYACFLVVAGEAELLRIGVGPSARRAGVGQALLREGLARLKRREVTLCHLEVAANNRGAIALYERLGFRQRGRRAGYYRDGVDALLFSRRVKGLDIGAGQI